MKKILIVEDEVKLAALEADYLRAEGFEPHCIANGLEVVPWVRANAPDLILLDLMLPGRVFSRDKLLEHLYADHRVVTDRTVDAHVKNLRRKLEEVRPGQELVHSIYGVGYKLEL